MKGRVITQTKILSMTIIAMAWAGRLLIWSSLFAPKYWEISADIADRDCPKTQISIDKNEDTIPTAASDSVALLGMWPTIAASVRDKMGSAIPAIMAGMAKRLTCRSVIKLVFSLFFHYQPKVQKTVKSLGYLGAGG